MTKDEAIDDRIYVGECTLFSHRYNGRAVTLSMQGGNVSTTHTTMTLTPKQQKEVIEWFCINRRRLVEDCLNDT